MTHLNIKNHKKMTLPSSRLTLRQCAAKVIWS